MAVPSCGERHAVAGEAGAGQHLLQHVEGAGVGRGHRGAAQQRLRQRERLHQFASGAGRIGMAPGDQVGAGDSVAPPDGLRQA